MQSYTNHAIKQRTGLCRGFSCDLSNYNTSDTRPAQADITLSVPRWSVSQRPDALQHITRYHRHARTLHRSAQPPYYNKAYKMVMHTADHASPAGSAQPPADRWQVLRPAHLLRGQRLHLYRVSPAASRCFPRQAACGLAPGQQSGRTGWHPPPGWAVQQQGRGGRRGTIGGYRRSSFRAFAR